MYAKCMAVKTITIDMEAYDLLSRHKTPGESFSRVIKAHFRRAPTVANFLAVAKRVRLSEDFLTQMEAIVADRTHDVLRYPKSDRDSS